MLYLKAYMLRQSSKTEALHGLYKILPFTQNHVRPNKSNTRPESGAEQTRVVPGQLVFGERVSSKPYESKPYVLLG